MFFIIPGYGLRRNKGIIRRPFCDKFAVGICWCEYRLKSWSFERRYIVKSSWFFLKRRQLSQHRCLKKLINCFSICQLRQSKKKYMNNYDQILCGQIHVFVHQLINDQSWPLISRDFTKSTWLWFVSCVRHVKKGFVTS